MRGDDSVYTLPITTANVARVEVVNNNAAALPAGLPYQPLSWSAITMYIDPKTLTMATLFGNDAAMDAVRAGRTDLTADRKGTAYPAGAVLALVTWAQRDDPHWFGARIPDVVRSVEFVRVAAAGQPSSYQNFAGGGLIEQPPTASVAAARTTFVLGLTPARLP